MKKFVAAFLMLTVLISLSYYVSATTDPGGAQIMDHGENSYVERTADSVDVHAGAIRNADLYAQMSTYRWAGLFGNVSGKIVLASGSGLSADKMFEWAANGSIVFASEGNSINWISLRGANETEMLSNYSFLGTGADNYNVTFIYNDTLETNTVAGGEIDANYALTKDNETTDYWKTFALTDGNYIVFAGVVDSDGHPSYNGTLSQFQMILPEDGTNGDVTATAYNIWVELV